jgi:hypothetical protein
VKRYELERNSSCKSLPVVILKGLGGGGSSFCSSLLHLNTSTIVKTTTPATVYTTEIDTQTSTAITTFHTYVPELRRRNFAKINARGAIATPAPLQKFNKSAISEACSCLRLPTKFTTITTTAPTPVSIRCALLSSVSLTLISSLLQLLSIQL